MVNYFALHEYFSVADWQLIGTFSLDNKKTYFPCCCIYGSIAFLVSKWIMGLYSLDPPQKHGTGSSQSQTYFWAFGGLGYHAQHPGFRGYREYFNRNSQQGKCRWLLAVFLFTQARADVFELRTRRWQGRAVHAALPALVTDPLPF